MAQTVADLLVKTLEQIGVKHIFGLIGDSLNGLTDAVSRSSIEWVGVRHEEGAALAAAAQAKLTGIIGVCAGTTGPGSTHLVSGLYEASRDHAPVLALSGDMARKLQGTDFIQTTKPYLLFNDVSVYSEVITTPEQAPLVIHQAIAAAYAKRGVSHLTLPQDIMVAAVKGDVPSIATLSPRAPIVPQEADIDDAVRRIEKSDKILIMCGHGCQGYANELRQLSDLLKAPLIHSVKGKDIMPYDESRWMGGIGMIGTKPTYHAAKNCDLFLMLGTDYPYSEYLPDKAIGIQIDERAEVLGRRTPTHLGIIGSVGPAINMLLRKLKQKENSHFFDTISKQREEWNDKIDKQADIKRSKDMIHPQAVARMVSDQAKDNAIFVLDTGLNTLWSGNWIRQRGQQKILGSFNNAAVGTALAQANGIQALDRSRQVIALCGDGGFNMLMCEFLTAVHHKLPVKVVIYNNASFGLIRLEAESVGIAPYNKGIEFPNPDFAAFATACGAHGFTAKKPEELQKAIADAFAVDGPAIIDAVVNPFEIPNLPHVDISMLQKYSIAKIKEAVNFVTGS
jgi:pyruvate dehydrogenase (quinone)